MLKKPIIILTFQQKKLEQKLELVSDLVANLHWHDS